MTEIPTKTCKICGKVFPKPHNVHGQAWIRREVCGMACSHVLMWNRRGRQTKPQCLTCGKIVAKRRMKYCSFACRTPRRTCAWCGKVGRIASPHKFCCWDCAVNASKTPVEIRICEHCGKSFEHKPNPITKGRFCSGSCGGFYNQEHRIVPDPLSEEQTAARIAGVHCSPISGPFATHHSALDWFLISPNQETFHIRNLHLFIRNHPDLFTEHELGFTPSGNQRAYSGLTHLAPSVSRRIVTNMWHEWRWWPEEEARWQNAFALSLPGRGMMEEKS